MHFLPAIRNGALAINFVLEAGHKNAGDALRVFQEIKRDTKLPWRHNIGSLSFGFKQDSPALQAADLLAYYSFRQECQAIEYGVSTDHKYVTSDGIEIELVYGCGLTMLEQRVLPDDLMTLRKNFLRKNKRPVFSQARVDIIGPDIDPSSLYASGAGLRPDSLR